MATDESDRPAVEGGAKVRRRPWPARRHVGREEKQAVVALLDEAARNGSSALAYHGPQEQAFCQAFAELLGGGFADGVNSGTNALWVALRALELEPGGEVIVPPVTDPGGVMPVALNHCVPVPADAEPGSYNAGVRQVADRLTEHTRAIIVAHIAGRPADVEPIVDLARSRQLPLIEDCAQALGATVGGRCVGTFGDLAVFSTMFGKHLSTGGQGGVVFTRDESLYWRVRRSADRGKPFNLDVEPAAAASPRAGPRTNIIAALNCNMDEIHAAIGRAQLRKLPRMLARRRELAAALEERCRRELTFVRVPGDPPGRRSAHWFTFFHLDAHALGVDVDTFAQAMAAEGIPAAPSYRAIPVRQEWHTRRRVFGTSGWPWTSPLYKGDADRTYPLANIDATTAEHFHVTFHEGCSPQEVDDFLAAAGKLERAYAARTPPGEAPGEEQTPP